MVTLQDLNQIVGAAARATPSGEVVIVYEDFSTGLKAKRLLDDRFAAFDPAGRYHLNLWEFKVLRLLSLRAQAVRDASVASIVCVATRGDEDLPPGVKEWAERWAREKTDHHSTLMLLTENAGDAPQRTTPVVQFLQHAANRRDAAFLFGSLDALGRQQVPVSSKASSQL